MQSFKPIETAYNGYRFRSRLEARWAVFFDALDIKYQYEPEGFKLGALGYYLPDFYLPDLDTWVEVKPTSGEENLEPFRKIWTVAKETGGKGLLLGGGNIWPGEVLMVLTPANNLVGCHETPEIYFEYPLYYSTIAMTPCCNSIVLFKLADDKMLRGNTERTVELNTRITDHPICQPIPVPHEAEITFFAYEKARQARFEHGDRQPSRQVLE